MSTDRAWHVSGEGAVATLTLDRPDRHNLLKMSEVDDLIGDLDALDADTSLRVIVVTGSGTRTFSAGVDLGDVLTRDWSDNPVERLADRIEVLRPVTVAALNGNVYGAAADLALACDFRIGVEDMKLVMPPARYGLVFHESGLRRFIEKLGPGTARQLFLASWDMAGQRLLETGYLDRLCARDDFADTVKAFAEHLASLSPLSLAITSKAITDISRGTLDSAGLKRETVACFSTDDAREGMAAARQKRPPRFTGR